MEDEQPDLRSVVRLAVAVEGGLIVVAWLCGWAMGHLPLEQFFWNAEEALLGVAATLPLLVLFFACLRRPLGPLRSIEQFCNDVIRPLFSSCSLLDLAGISILAGLGEEMLFRGVLQIAFSDWFGHDVAGLIVASVIFGLCHAITPTYAVLATLMGGFLGALLLFTGNLLPAVVAHAVYDFVALVVLVKRRIA